jgi:hypothetical protein
MKLEISFTHSLYQASENCLEDIFYGIGMILFLNSVDT